MARKKKDTKPPEELTDEDRLDLFKRLSSLDEDLQTAKENFNDVLKAAEDTYGIKKSILKKSFKIWNRGERAEFDQECETILELSNAPAQ